jgi:tripartite-type tricarboxylate transporter receptor subunit TctC
VVVTNHGAGTFAAEIVAKAPPDGYSVLLYGSNVWLSPFLRDDVPWDPIKSFSPVTLATKGPNLLVVHPALPVRSVKELIALAKSRPGALNYASGSTGSSPHLAAELFKAHAHVDIVRISYRGNALAYADVLRGEVPLIFPTAASVAPHLKSGRLRALAVTTKERSRLFPGLPTVAEGGLPNYEAATLVGVFVPARTPAAVIARLNRELASVLSMPEIQARFTASGVETVGSTPEEFAETIKSEMARLGSVIKAAGIRDE